jgi:hypothetical protein
VGQALAFLVLYGHVYTLAFDYITELLLSSCSRVSRTILLLVLHESHFQTEVEMSGAWSTKPTLQKQPIDLQNL